MRGRQFVTHEILPPQTGPRGAKRMTLLVCLLSIQISLASESDERSGSCGYQGEEFSRPRGSDSKAEER